MTSEELSALKADLRSKHPNSTLKGFQFGDDLVVIRNPTMAERTLYLPRVKRNDDAAANKQFTLQVTVYPDTETMKEILERKPFICERLSNEAIDLGGMGGEDLGEF